MEQLVAWGSLVLVTVSFGCIWYQVSRESAEWVAGRLTGPVRRDDPVDARRDGNA